MTNEFKDNQLVQLENISVLARVITKDPDNERNVIIKPVDSEKTFSFPKANLKVLG